jgi:hypothetical protein
VLFDRSASPRRAYAGAFLVPKTGRSATRNRIGVVAWALVAACALAGLPSAYALTVTRGPYLQMGTATTQVLRWRTDVASDSQVRLGTSPANLAPVADDPVATTEHSVKVTGLAAGTVYYYSVGTKAGALAGGDVGHFFVTPPPPGTADAVRVWVLGDAGTAGPTGFNADQAAVRDAYTAWNKQYTDLLLMLGDNAYNSGTDAEYQNAVFNMYGGILRQTNVWSTVSNHDTNQSTDPNMATTAYFSVFTIPTAGEAGGVASGTRKYYSFDFANIHFVSLDSMASDRSVNGPMLTWLARDLAANRKPWLVAFWHHAPYTKGSHDSDAEIELIEMRANALPILEAYGVDLVLAGHSHSYERSKLIGGHYGPSSTLASAMIKDAGSGRTGDTGAYDKGPGTKSAVYAVVGSSGKVSGGPLDHPAMFTSLNELGSLVLDVDGDRLDAKFLRDDGVVADSFTIVKTPARNHPASTMRGPAAVHAAANVPAAPSALLVRTVSKTQVDLRWKNNSGNETAFAIERSTDGRRFAQIATVAAGTTAYSSTGLAAGKAYFYRVRAINGSGNSAYSNIACAGAPRR